MCEYCEKLTLIDLSEANEGESSFSTHIDHRGNNYSQRSYYVLNVSHLLDLGYCGDKYFEADILIKYCPFCGRKLEDTGNV